MVAREALQSSIKPPGPFLPTSRRRTECSLVSFAALINPSLRLSVLLLHNVAPRKANTVERAMLSMRPLPHDRQREEEGKTEAYAEERRRLLLRWKKGRGHSLREMRNAELFSKRRTPTVMNRNLSRRMRLRRMFQIAPVQVGKRPAQHYMNGASTLLYLAFLLSLSLTGRRRLLFAQTSRLALDRA